MDLGMVGLGKMGGNMTTRLLQAGHRIFVWDRNPPKVQRAETGGAIGTATLAGLAEAMPSPRAIWLMLPAGEPTETALNTLAEVWRYGSVVRSWLLDLTAAALEGDQDLAGLEAWVADSGEGRWTVFEGIDLDIPAPVITLSLLMRLVSRQEHSFAAKLLAALRQQFGGHAVKPAQGGSDA